MASLKPVLNDAWPRVRKRHLFPELPRPQWDEGTPSVGLSIRHKQISISRQFVSGMSQRLKPREVIEGLLDHAVSHYLYCPWSFATHLRLYAAANDTLKDGDMALKALDRFMDVAADTICLSRLESPLSKIYRQLDKGFLDEVVYALCQILWGENLGVKRHSAVANRLARIGYTDRSRWMAGIRQFAELLKPYLMMEKDDGSLAAPSPMGSHGIEQYSQQDIREGLKELASDTASPMEFAALIHDFEPDIAGALDAAGRGPGEPPPKALDARIVYYMKLAENYLLPVRKAPMARSGFLYPYKHVPWEAGRPYQDMDIWTSFGKLLPGISKTWERMEGKVFGQEPGIPDCIVMIDSSGSMKNPGHALSYAVLGAACACDTYLRNDARVAVYNFGDAAAGGRQILSYTRCREEIYQSLCRYFGGGTHFALEDIESLQNQGAPDIFLISDMQITNLEILIQYLNTCRNRVTAVHIGDNECAGKFRNSLDLRENIAINAVKKIEDIPRIVLGKIGQYLC